MPDPPHSPRRAGRSSGGRAAAARTAERLVRLRWAVILFWAAAAAVAALLGPGLGDTATDLGVPIPGDAPALAAQRRSAEDFGLPLATPVSVVIRRPGGLTDRDRATVLAAALRTDLVGVVARLARERLPAGVAPAAGPAFAVPLLDGLGVAGSPATDPTTTAITYLYTRGDAWDATGAGERYARRLPPGATAGVTGSAPAQVAHSRIIRDHVGTTALATLALIALLVGAAFRSPVAPVAVLATAGVGYLVNGGLLGALQAHLGVPLPSDFEPLLVVLLLGMVTDYAVFFMFAQRRRLAAGETPHEAAAAAAARTGPIVLAAGFAVAGVSAALLTSRLEFFRAFGPGLSITAAVATLVVVTLVPALLSVLGPRLLWPGGPRRREEGRAEGRREALAGRLSDRRAAAAVAVVTTAALLAGATGLRGADLGVGLIDALPGSAEPARAADAAAAGFAPGIIAPTVVLVEGRRLDARRPALRRLGRLLGRRGGVAGVLGPGAPSAGAAPGALVAASGSAARYAVVLDGRPFGRDAMSTVGRLAHDLPRLLRRAGLGDAHARVAGETALARQTTAFMDRELIRVGGVAIVVSLVLLVIFLRALVAPLFLAAASVLSVAATLGLSRYLFQGLLGRGPLVYYVPFAAGALMLAFASDYNIFLAGRIWEAARTRPLAEAIASAAPRATRPIGLAGLVLAGSFALLALVPLVPFRQFAFVMAGGILLEAFVVRPLLVPAGLRLIGQAAMWPRSRRGAP